MAIYSGFFPLKLVIFHGYVNVYQRVFMGYSWDIQDEPMDFYMLSF
jgi:hypothetical protein